MSSDKNQKKQKSSTPSDEELRTLVQDASIPSGDRGDLLAFALADRGLDHRACISELLEQADFGRATKQEREGEGENTLTSERFLGVLQQNGLGTYAMVTFGGADVCMPVSQEQIDDLSFGEAIYVDTKAQRIVGRDGHLPLAGDVVSVKSILPNDRRHVVVSHHDRDVLARVPDYLLAGDGNSCQPGGRVVYDPVKRFVVSVLDDEPTGEHLLADPNGMESVRRSDVGAPKPVVDEIIRRLRRYAVHPNWMRQMKARQRVSYFFVGGTGCGKSFHLKLIVTEFHDLVEQITGTRTSRVVMLDASHFWSSLFGSTEQRIAAWADQIQAIGSQPLFDREGRKVGIPLVIILEEAESLLRNRGEDGGGSSHLFDRPLALLLQKTESLETAINAPICWLMSSNKPSLLDPAAQRRFGTRQVNFGPLHLAQAGSVLATKVPAEMPIYGSHNGSDGRSALINTVLGYLYGPEPRQEIAEVHLASSQRRKLHRRDLVTPAILDEAISSAVDRCLDKSEKAGELLGLDANDVVGFLAKHYVNLARTIRPHNVADHCPDWFRDEPEHVTNVVPSVQRSRPRALLME